MWRKPSENGKNQRNHARKKLIFFDFESRGAHCAPAFSGFNPEKNMAPLCKGSCRAYARLRDCLFSIYIQSTVFACRAGGLPLPYKIPQDFPPSSVGAIHESPVFIFGVSRLKIRNWVDDAENLLYSFSQYPFIHSRIISPSVFCFAKSSSLVRGGGITKQ